MISFFTADITYSLKSRTNIRHWLSKVASSEKKRISSLNIIFCSDDYLYKMNRQFLKHNTFTDIITFDNSVDFKHISGELYISLDRIRDNAATLGVTIKDELHRVIVHGLLHLCGYTDKTPSDRKKMSLKEDYYLQRRQF